MKDITVTTMSKYLYDLLTVEDLTGDVHSVYRKTVNLHFASASEEISHLLVALQAKDSPISPLTMLLPLTKEEMEGLGIMAGAPVSVSDHIIRIGENRGQERDSGIILIDFGKTKLVKTGLKKDTCSSRLIDAKLALASTILSSSTPVGFASLIRDRDQWPDDLILNAAGNNIYTALEDIENHKLDSCVGHLIKLIGMGIGLTPGGDDFLCGTLGSLYATGLWDHPFSRLLRMRITESLDRTNDISASFLRCALRGQYSLAVVDFFRMRKCESSHLTSDVHRLTPDAYREEFTKAVQGEFQAIGHSSGMDSLTGLYFGLKIGQSLSKTTL
ncbi:MAG: DUF2877 domain-containing protein [Lachnospiraceae bacterium]|nr:DUF2877 domain-containing protein [Lachnospiraceae bacterium]